MKRYKCPVCHRRLLIELEGKARKVEDTQTPTMAPKGAKIAEHDCVLDDGLSIEQLDTLLKEGKVLQG